MSSFLKRQPEPKVRSAEVFDFFGSFLAAFY